MLFCKKHHDEAFLGQTTIVQCLKTLALPNKTNKIGTQLIVLYFYF